MGKSKLCGIYCIENLVNGKKYVGQSVDLIERLADHRNRLRAGTHKNLHLQSSWKTHGEENFDFYIIEQCGVDFLDEREIYYIAELHTQDDKFGYNIEPGGHISKTMSESTKEKIRNALCGRIFTEEHRKKISEANRRREVSNDTRRKMSENHADFRGEKHPQYGTHLSEETKRKMMENRNYPRGKEHHNYGKHLTEATREKLRKSHVGICAGSKHPQCRPVYCPELKENFWGAKEVEEKYHIPANYIAAVLSGRQKTAGKHPITGEPLHWQDAVVDSLVQITQQND